MLPGRQRSLIIGSLCLGRGAIQGERSIERSFRGETPVSRSYWFLYVLPNCDKYLHITVHDISEHHHHYRHHYYHYHHHHHHYRLLLLILIRIIILIVITFIAIIINSNIAGAVPRVFDIMSTVYTRLQYNHLHSLLNIKPISIRAESRFYAFNRGS